MNDLWGFKNVQGPSGWGFARPAVEAWLSRTLRDGRTLREVAAAHPGAREMKGRGPVWVVTEGGMDLVVRPYLRGGLVAAPLLVDRYLRVGLDRPVAEAVVSQELVRRAIPTPEVVAGAVYPAGPFYRADLVTVYIPRSRDLATVLFVPPLAPAPIRLRALQEAGRLVARLAAGGVNHPDLNARNILLVPEKGGLNALLLDLDRCRVGEPLPTKGMLKRLEHSLRKLASATGEPIEEKELWELRNACDEHR